MISNAAKSSQMVLQSAGNLSLEDYRARKCYNTAQETRHKVRIDGVPVQNT